MIFTCNNKHTNLLNKHLLSFLNYKAKSWWANNDIASEHMKQWYSTDSCVTQTSTRSHSVDRQGFVEKSMAFLILTPYKIIDKIQDLPLTIILQYFSMTNNLGDIFVEIEIFLLPSLATCWP